MHIKAAEAIFLQIKPVTYSMQTIFILSPALHKRKHMQTDKTSKATVTPITTGYNQGLQNSRSERNTRPILKHCEYKYTRWPLYRGRNKVHIIKRLVSAQFTTKFADQNLELIHRLLIVRIQFLWSERNGSISLKI